MTRRIKMTAKKLTDARHDLFDAAGHYMGPLERHADGCFYWEPKFREHQAFSAEQLEAVVRELAKINPK